MTKKKKRKEKEKEKRKKKEEKRKKVEGDLTPISNQSHQPCIYHWVKGMDFDIHL